MTDHIADAGKMVPDDWVDAALDAYSDNEWRTSASAMRAALAAVAPMIAKAERERIAAGIERMRDEMREQMRLAESGALSRLVAMIRALD